jgi:hypothetical protein
LNTELVVKSKSGQVGMPVRTESRLAVRQYTDENLGDEAVYVMIKILAGRPQPWDDEHPAPTFPLE